MAVKRVRHNRNRQDGQAILEVLFALPLMLALFMVMSRVNEATQISIVNQKYVRGQILFLNQNSAVYPRRNLVESDSAGFTKSNRVILGMADQVFPSEKELDDSNRFPIAPHFRVTRAPNKPRAGIDQSVAWEATERSVVQVTTTASLCTPSHSVCGRSGGALAPAIKLAAGAPQPVQSEMTGLNDGARLAYCASYIDETGGICP